jgi:predicted ATPase
MKLNFPELAEQSTSRGIEEAEGTGEFMFLSELHRVNAEVVLRTSKGNEATAEQGFRKAIELAHKQGAKLYELRASVSLARLLRETGHREEARTMLAEIYSWFTEGFDTADLKEAKALLEELSSSR